MITCYCFFTPIKNYFNITGFMGNTRLARFN